MEVMHDRCCGLDVHKKTVVACLLIGGRGRSVEREVRTFGTTTRELLTLSDWLREASCTHVAMESTGSYWKPVYNILEQDFTLLVVNAQHLKAVPGRKTDVRDAEWIADLLRHGLVRPSFIPSRPERELRELTRYRTSLVRERTSEINRLQKVLEGGNLKLASVVTNIVGLSGRSMLEALVAGEQDIEAIVALARGKVRSKKAALREALDSRLDSHQRFLLGIQLRHIREVTALIDEVSSEIELRLRPLEQALTRLVAIPGFGPRIAETFLSEVGGNMERFASPQRLASWAGLCPGNNESAGKNKSGRTRKGSPWLRASMVEAATAAGRTKTYLGAQYRRLAARRGARRAAVAVAHSLIVVAYYVLSRGEEFRDLGANYFDERQRDQVVQNLTRRLQTLGYQVMLAASP